MQQHELALKDYILGMKYKDIATKYNVSINTVQSWKVRHKWERDKPVKSSKKTAHNAHKNKSMCKPVQQEPDEELSEQEQLFSYHYVRTHNMTQAALLAGYGKGDKRIAQVLGSRLYHRPKVKQEIDRLHELFKQDLHLDIQDFLDFCLKVVGADLGDYLKFGKKSIPVMGALGPVIDPKTKRPVKRAVNYIDLVESGQVDTSVIEEIKQGKDGISIKLADKKWAWEQLIKFFDWLPDQWQRKVDTERLQLESRKVEAIEKKAGGEGDTKPIEIVIKRKEKAP